MRWTSIALSIVACVAIVTSAGAQVCEPEQQPLKYGDASGTIRSFVCKPSAAAPPLFRVTFHRVSEYLAGSLIKQTTLPEIDNIIGRHELYKNDTYKEARALFDQFGSMQNYGTVERSRVESSWELSVNGAKVDTQVFNPIPVRGRSRPLRTIWNLSQGSWISQVLLKAPGATIWRTDQWPANFNQFYTCSEYATEFIGCTVLWRYIGVPDFDSILQDVRELRQRIERKARQVALGLEPDYEKHFRLFRYLARATKSLPEDFLPLRLDLAEEGCGGDSWGLTYYARPLLLDIAVVENVAQEPVRIEDLLGWRGSSTLLRPSGEAASSQTPPNALNAEPASLQPGRRLVIPVALTFADGTRRQPETNGAASATAPQTAPEPKEQKDRVGEGADTSDTPDDTPVAKPDPWGKMTDAEATYKKIKAKPEPILSEKVLDKVVRKSRDSFKAPTLPNMSSYLFGPEISLAGAIVNGQRFLFGAPPGDPSRTNTLELSVSEYETGISCPILYVWNEAEGIWINLGKIIHQADGPDKVMSQRVVLSALHTSFRIEEAELEMSHIAKVQLALTLRDGRRIAVPSPNAAFDGVIPAYSSLEIKFDIPRDVSPEEVVTTEIEITGYYQRYTSILSAAATGSPQE